MRILSCTHSRPCTSSIRQVETQKAADSLFLHSVALFIPSLCKPFGISLTPLSREKHQHFRPAILLLCRTFLTFTCVHLQPVDPGEVFQDAAGEGDDQVDVDVGVVFNASVTKGEQTLVYASSHIQLCMQAVL